MRFEKHIAGAGFIVLPFIFSASPGEQMREPKAQFLAILMGLVISSLLFRKVAWSLGCAAFALYAYAFLAKDFHAAQILTLTAALGSCLLIAEAKKHDIKIGLEVLEAAGVLCAAYAMLKQFSGLDQILHMTPGNDFRRVSVFFGQHTLYGPFCVAAAAPALFRGRFFKTMLIALPIPLIDSSFTYLAAGAVVAVYLVFRHGKPALIALSLAAIAGSAIIAPKLLSEQRIKIEALNDNGRFALWQLTFRIAKVNPFFGKGFGSFSEQFPVFQSPEMQNQLGVKRELLSPAAVEILNKAKELFDRSGFFLSPHNEFLDVFYEFGGFGLLIVVALLCAFGWAFCVAEKTVEAWAILAIFLSFLADSCGNFPFHLIPQALIPLWSFVAMTTLRKQRILEA